MSEFLEVYRENAEDLIEESLPFVVAGRFRYGELLEFCENYRIRGIARLLLDAEPAALHTSLHDGARAFAYGIRRLDRGELVASEATPLLDAIACGARDVAAELAAALDVGWQSGVEYEDDYLYYSLIRQWAAAGGVPAGALQTLEALEKAATPAAPRAVVARALHAGDAVAFEDGIMLLLAEHEHRHRLLVERGRLSDEAAATLPFLCVEGLALLRLAEASGLALGEEYPFIPSIARGNFSSSFSAEGWQRAR